MRILILSVAPLFSITLDESVMFSCSCSVFKTLQSKVYILMFILVIASCVPCSWHLCVDIYLQHSSFISRLPFSRITCGITL